jgi:hypothetical protein
MADLIDGKYADDVMTRRPSLVIIFHNHEQASYERLKREALCPVRTIKGGPTETLKTKPGTLLILDDLQGSHAAIVSQWFTRKSHHYDTSVAYLVQNLFDKTPHHRTISLNATYIILFKNPRDASQVEFLDRQMFPNSGNRLTRAYREVTRDTPYAYLVIDCTQDTPDAFRLRNTLFMCRDYPHAYAFVDENDDDDDDDDDDDGGRSSCSSDED